MMAGKPKDPVARFWAKVRKSDGCWEWTASTQIGGYGQFGVRGTMMMAHRYSYELVHGPIPPGRVIMHACDNRLCVNPSHLSMGTHADNVRDMHSKDRHARGDTVASKGTANPKAVLTDDDVIAIRTAYAAREATQVELAKKYGVKQPAISAIVLGRLWRHLLRKSAK